MIEGQAGQGQCTQMKLYTRIAAIYWEQQIHAVRERRAVYLSCDCITLTKKKTTYTNKLAGWRRQHCCCCWGEQQVSKSCINVWSAARRKGEGKREAESHCIQLTSVIEIQMKVK